MSPLLGSEGGRVSLQAFFVTRCGQLRCRHSPFFPLEPATGHTQLVLFPSLPVWCPHLPPVSCGHPTDVEACVRQKCGWETEQRWVLAQCMMLICCMTLNFSEVRILLCKRRRLYSAV